MSSTASPPRVEEPPFRRGFDPARHGRRAECDGGRHVPGTKFAGRQFFEGTLTGDYRDFGPYPWRWFLMTSLTKKPAGYGHEAVWCDESSLTLLDDD
ncbi:MAG: hypothetical protein IPI06_05840 [Gammaproteobacteria bacterium]|nr:hypothetical protein [Gammaproteobacteria bacterium]